ncbi:protein containing SET domain [Longilinea arvoryzae]|uniref:Protein containing SET domain n=1 Tax=Longilinea arvoryzae TaxID=360412 RepID=A0A0S7BIP9_9CHLR|nr:SET domain-containing protein-lysine N-methyltransferase [Longilinea arvoryzae]GAP14050.1 protein containing SET domain [Longilinea arvoryzae]
MSPVSIYSYIHPKLEVRPAPVNGGWGVFAREAIGEGELLVVWGGEIRTADQIGALLDGDACHGLQVDEGVYLWSIREGDTGDYVNHSCNPNAWISGQISLLARRDIEPGEEITFDYATTDASDYDTFACHCGDPLCRGVVTGQDWRRADLQGRYKGHFSAYIQRRIDSQPFA